MVSRLADLRQASIASQNQLPPVEGAQPHKRKKTHSALNNPCYKYGNPTSRIVGTYGKRPKLSPTSNRRTLRLRCICFFLGILT